ncbi:other/FunK1 protein kinase [Coprinopsis cinerea AmutBmut pab1-1]|nr:other/FunK1 protein kinase [Coprinopsis cinerea AmutBmut pab1-1]
MQTARIGESVPNTTNSRTTATDLYSVSAESQTGESYDASAGIIGFQIDTFCEYYLPPIREGWQVFDQVIATLIETGTLVPLSDKDFPGRPNYQFKDLERSRSSYDLRLNEGTPQGHTAALDEKTHLTAIGRVFNAVRDILQKDAGVSVNEYSMAVCPGTHLEAGTHDVSFRIEAYITNIGVADGKWQTLNGRLDSTNITIPLECNIDDDKDKDLNWLKLVATANHIMNVDARRMFMYGITIEGHHVSLWYFSRSHTVKAESFSLIERPDILVKIFISLACATNEELGFDPHITLLSEQKYLYELPPNSADRPEPMFFMTTDTVHEKPSLRISGRCTRVWKVVEVISKDKLEQKPGTSEMVLKDTWADEDVDTEDKIQAKLFQDIETFSKTKKWKSHPLLAGLRKFHKSEMKSFGDALQDFRNYFSCILHAHAKGPTKSVVAEARSSQDTPSKRRCFYVFEHVCVQVSHLPTLGDALDVIRQAYFALLLKFCAGWIHRDISDGNVLAFKQPDGSWQVKLSDLEYAKRFPPKDSCEASSEPKVGTPHFMAHEIQLSRSLFRRRLIERIILAPQSDSDSDSESESKEDTQETKATENNELMPIDTPVTHNYEHDLESIWWLVLWLITMRVDHEPSYTAADDIFTGTVPPSAERITAFIGGLPRELKESLHPDLQSLFHPLESFRQRLVAGYEDRHPDNLYHPQHYSPECAAFAAFWKEIKRGGDQWRKVELKSPSWMAPRPPTTFTTGHMSNDSSNSSERSKSGLMKRKSIHQQMIDEAHGSGFFVDDEDVTEEQPFKKSRRH